MNEDEREHYGDTFALLSVIMGSGIIILMLISTWAMIGMSIK